MDNNHSTKFVFILFIFLFVPGLIYALEANEHKSIALKDRILTQVYFNPHIKTCVNKKTLFYANAPEEDVFEGYICKWDFGDGSTAEGREITDKIYTEPGTYVVRLTLYDKTTNRTLFSTQNRVVVYSPPIAKAGEDIIICSGKTAFFNGSRSKATNFIERCFNCNLLSYVWDFGDGSPEARGVKVRHTYNKAGLYKATLTVQDGKGRKCSVSQDTVSVLVNNSPAIVLRQVKEACAGNSLVFGAFVNASKTQHTDRASLRYTWDFGDGTVTEGGPNISHVYQRGGEYMVSVIADDRLGSPCSIDIQTMKVKVKGVPVANAGPNLVCCVNKESVFDGSSSYGFNGRALTYEWDFGDGATARGVKVTHVYKKVGKYKVILKVDDNSGTPCSSSMDSFEVNVSAEPVAVMEVR